MPRIRPVEPEDAPQGSREYIEKGKQQTGGQVINFFKQMYVSPVSFQAYMDFGDAIGPYLVGRPEVRHVEAVG